MTPRTQPLLPVSWKNYPLLRRFSTPFWRSTPRINGFLWARVRRNYQVPRKVSQHEAAVINHNNPSTEVSENPVTLSFDSSTCTYLLFATCFNLHSIAYQLTISIYFVKCFWRKVFLLYLEFMKRQQGECLVSLRSLQDPISSPSP